MKRFFKIFTSGDEINIKIKKSDIEDACGDSAQEMACCCCSESQAEDSKSSSRENQDKPEGEAPEKNTESNPCC